MAQRAARLAPASLPADALPACDLAIAHLSTAASGGIADANDPPLGPWATRPELARVWTRDRFLGKGFLVTDDRSTTAAALLARTQPAAWKDQLAFARALYGEITGPSFESLATGLTGMTDEALGTAEAMDRVRKEASRLAPDTGFAPAALAHASSPEQQILEPLGMTAWDDPMAALIAAIQSGKLDLTPKSDAGFYRHRWFALETLAVPGKAPEQHKLKLSDEYQQRWQRAFAAGFAEGRSGFVKRLPMSVAGSRGEGPIRMDVAPSFSAEPSPDRLSAPRPRLSETRRGPCRRQSSRSGNRCATATAARLPRNSMNGCCAFMAWPASSIRKSDFTRLLRQPIRRSTPAWQSRRPRTGCPRWIRTRTSRATRAISCRLQPMVPAVTAARQCSA